MVELEIQSKQKREESSKNKSQLPVRASPVIARKPSGPLHANASGLVDRPAEMKDSGLLIRMQRPKTRAATTGQLISKSAGFGKLKKNFLGLDLPVVDSDIQTLGYVVCRHRTTAESTLKRAHC